MKRLAIALVFSVFCLTLSTWDSVAQDRKLITGKIYNKVTGKPFGKNDLLIEIYGFDTEALAEDAMAALEANDVVSNAYAILPPDETGAFQATVPQNGAIVIKPGISKPILVRINYKTEFSIPIDAGEIIQASTKTESLGTIQAMDPVVEVTGNYLAAVYNFKVPKNIGRGNARLILQPVFIDGVTNDTLSFLRPWVYDGEQYELTQERRMSYDRENDPLTKYVRPEKLTSEEFVVPWSDTVYLSNPNGRYYIKGKLVFEDYNMVYYSRDSLPLASSRARRPMRFLDYQLDFRNLDPEDYHVRAMPEKMGSAGEMSLTFVVNKAQFDSKDPNNAISLNKLKNDIMEIVTGEFSTLTEFHLVGISSPDGRYSSNLELANKRTRYAFEQIVSVLPKYARDRIYMTDKSEVAPWSDVVGLLEADGLQLEAERVREICETVKGHDAQGAQIRKLPFYKSEISPRLPKLRTVKYTYKFEELRELTPEEILDRYRNDEEYKSGKKHFALYEYWQLFRLLEDPEELEAVYKRAYDESAEDNASPWIFAANNLAYSYLKKSHVDTTVLAPFIDRRYKCNMEIMHLDGTKEKVNPAPVVANQLCMYLMANDFDNASVLSQMLPNTDEYKLFKAITMCLGGYYKGGDTEEERQQRAEWFEIVKESSPRNRVVMLLAQNTRSYTALAERALEELSEDDPLTWYFKAVISGRKCNYADADFMEPMNFETYLMQCFDMDKQYVGIARSDGDIDEDELKSFFKFYPEYDKF